MGAAVLSVLSGSLAASASSLEMATSPSGLSSLTYRGVNLVGNGDLSMQSVEFGTQAASLTEGSTTPTLTTADQTARKVVRIYPWGTVSCKYTGEGDKLVATVEVSNRSPQPLRQFTLQLLDARFPQAPKDWVHDYVYVGSNLGDPTVVTADYGSGEMAVCNDDVTGKPLLVGFPGRASLTDRPVVISTTPGWFMTPYLDKRVVRPIAPGASDIYHISVRFAPSGTAPEVIAADLIHKLAEAYPPVLNWPDRRPIGTIHLATSEDNHHTRNNPSGWFLDPNGVDVTTPAGRAAFKLRVMKYADDSITVLKDTGAQGMIVWDIEGEAHGNVAYYGDPRQMGKLAPEMDACADEFFKKFSAAGLKTGVCVRPQDLVDVTGPGIAQHDLSDPEQITNLLFSKISYASKRWGCTIFYVDSNGDPNAPYDVSIFKNLTERMAGAGIKGLVIPEHKTTRYFAYTAPYAELRLGFVDSPAMARAAYPNGFECNYVPDGPVDKDRSGLVRAVKRGEVLMFRGWWPDSFNAQVKSIYTDAKDSKLASR